MAKPLTIKKASEIERNAMKILWYKYKIMKDLAHMSDLKHKHPELTTTITPVLETLIWKSYELEKIIDSMPIFRK